MSLIKSEPSETSSVVDLSSDEELSTMVSSEPPPLSPKTNFLYPGRPGTPETHCSICLEEFTDKCYPDICIHMFCFECLKRWSAVDSTCPLCKKKFHQIYHSLSEDTHETYDVPRQDRELSPRIFLRPFGEISDVSRFFRMNLLFDLFRDNTRQLVADEIIGEDSYNLNDPNSGMRVRVYTDDIWSEPLPDLSGRFRECGPTFYRENPAQMHRLHVFIVRDINAIRSIDNNLRCPNEFLLNLILMCILNHGIRDPGTINMLRPYLGSHSAHFCHELYNYANSPYDLMGYDRYVYYNTRINSPTMRHNELHTMMGVPHVTEAPVTPVQILDTIVLDSDDSADQSYPRYPEIINLDSSSGDDSDIEILSQTFRPIEVLNSRDQPSTSTGIRESLQPYNRYNMRRRLFPSASNTLPYCRPAPRPYGLQYPSITRRERIDDLVSSSSDEEPISLTRSSLPKHLRNVCGTRKRKVKKNKLKKRKRIVDNTVAENCISSRSRSHSESSSSSGGDTDYRPNNNYVPIHSIEL